MHTPTTKGEFVVLLGSSRIDPSGLCFESIPIARNTRSCAE
jgi:hypothetical protein